MFDFPNTPTTGSIATAPTGAAYRWDGVKWVPLGSGGAPSVYVSDTPPASPIQGTLWFDSAGGQLYVWYVDPNTSQWVPSNAPLQTQPVVSGFGNVGRNLVHNALFNIWQRGTGAFTSGYTADRWNMAAVSDTVSVTQQSFALAGLPSDEAATFCLTNVFTGTAGAGAYNFHYQPIEGVRRLSNKTVIVSFWAAAQGTPPKLGVTLTQSFGTGGSPSGQVPLNGQAVTLTNVWTRYSVVFTLPSLAGKTLGTNNNDATQLEFWYSSGTNFTARSGGVGVQSGNVGLWGVQLEIAQSGQTQPTPLEKIDPGEDLRRCQRFFESFNITQDFVSPGSGWTYLMRSYRFAVTKRAMPTTTFAGMTYYSGGSVVAFPGTPTAFGTSQDMVGFGYNGLTSAAGFAGGNVSVSADL